MKRVLITGAGGGLGGAAAALFVERGWTVYAADLRPPPAEDDLVPLEMDVTSRSSIDRAVARIGDSGLDCVVNFAGIMVVGPLVEIDEEVLRTLLDVNVLGTFRVNQAVFPLLRARGGRIINISSETGWQRAIMMNGPYAMSKHAVEAYSDALRQELMFLDVPVSVIQPGPFRSDMTRGIGAAFEAATRPGSPFETVLRTAGRLASGEEAKSHDPRVLAEVVWRAATARRPRHRYSVRPDLGRRALHHLPSPVADRLLRGLLDRLG